MEINFNDALKYLEECEKTYTEIGSSGLFALQFCILPLRDRYNKGERTQALYDAIFDIRL